MPQGTLAPVDEIRRLRYEHGLTCPAAAARLGVHEATVRSYAPGYPGKIDNAALREAFLRSGVSAAEVARRIGWVNDRRIRRADADSSRVKRTLGILPSVSGQGHSSYRKLIDAETAGLIAEAIGVAPWEIGAQD